MRGQSVITRKIAVAKGVYAPGHLGELTQVVDFDLVDAVAEETGTVEQRTRLLPTRVVIYFVLALALFERCGYLRVWAKMVAGLRVLSLATPRASSLVRARRRVGPKPFRALFAALGGPVGQPATPGVFWRGMRTVAVDATCLHVANSWQVLGRYARRAGERVARLSWLCGCEGPRTLDLADFRVGGLSWANGHKTCGDDGAS